MAEVPAWFSLKLMTYLSIGGCPHDRCTASVPIPAFGRLLTAAAFQNLAAEPPELEWFANLGSMAPAALTNMPSPTSCGSPASSGPKCSGTVTVCLCHRLAAPLALFGYLCERNAVMHNPVKGVKCPVVESYEGKTSALGYHQARGLLDAPEGDTLTSTRNRAMPATSLHHALRREEPCKPKVKGFRQERRGVAHLKDSGKGQQDALYAAVPRGRRANRGSSGATGQDAEDASAVFRSLYYSRS